MNLFGLLSSRDHGCGSPGPWKTTALNLTQMVVAMKRTVETEVSGRSLNLSDELCGDGFEFGIDRFGRRQAELGGRTRRQGEAERLEGIVDRIGINGRLIDAFGFPASEERKDALVPEREMSQERSYGPAIGGGTVEVGVRQATDEALKSAPG
jgi:hypothetical protein